VRFISAFFSGHSRSVKAKKNILAVFFLKGLSVIISFVFVPLSIKFLGTEKYGIWLTVSSVIAWINIFDFGLGNGLRNKLVESITLKKNKLAKTYVSTSYVMVFLLSVLIFVFSFLLLHYIDLPALFNVHKIYEQELNNLVIIVLAVFSVQFVVKLINSVFLAIQQPAYSNLLNTLASAFALLAVFVLYNFYKGNLIAFAFIVSVINVIVPLIASIVMYSTKLKAYAPSFRYVDFSKLKSLFNLSILFFITQSAALIVYATDNLIITNISGPQEVTNYQVAFKYFNIIIVFYTIITTPLWSAFTEAFIQKDMQWIKNVFRKYLILWTVTILVILLMLFIAPYFYTIWVGSTVTVSPLLNVLIAFWVLLSTFIMIFSNFLNGVNKIRLSMYQSVIVAIINIPLSFYFGKNLGMGSSGVILATIICISLRVIFQPYQVYKILRGEATGIWNK
jgi:O-antigen/teichoic acid export membrane protein